MIIVCIDIDRIWKNRRIVPLQNAHIFETPTVYLFEDDYILRGSYVYVYIYINMNRYLIQIHCPHLSPIFPPSFLSEMFKHRVTILPFVAPHSAGHVAVAGPGAPTGGRRWAEVQVNVLVEWKIDRKPRKKIENRHHGFMVRFSGKPIWQRGFSRQKLMKHQWIWGTDRRNRSIVPGKYGCFLYISLGSPIPEESRTCQFFLEVVLVVSMDCGRLQVTGDPVIEYHAICDAGSTGTRLYVSLGG